MLQDRLTQQAIEFHQAIHGSEPEYSPYKDASDAPFRGIPIETMNELVNKDEVSKELKAWKKSMTEQHSKVSHYAWVKGKEFTFIVDHHDKYILTCDLIHGKVKYLHKVKVRPPNPSERDLLNAALKKSHKLGHLYTEGTAIIDQHGREGVILSTFKEPIAYNNGTRAILPLYGDIEIFSQNKTISNTSILSIHLA